MIAQDANAIPVTDDHQVRPMHHQHLQTRPTFHVSREMVCFVAGLAVAAGMFWLCAQMASAKRGRD